MKRICLLLLVLVLILSLFTGCKNQTETTPIGTGAPATAIGTAPNDPVIDKELFAGSNSYESLLTIVKASIESGQYRANTMMKAFGAPERSLDTAAVAQNAPYSTTNVQSAGVDEADMIKTDGRYLYYLANNRLYIVDAGSDQPQVIYTKYFNPNVTEGNKSHGENPVELYLDAENKRLVVILNGYLNENVPIEAKPASGKLSGMMIPSNNKQYTITRVYQIDDPKNPKMVRQFTQEGGYMTSRLVADTVYVLSNKYDYSIYGGVTDKEITTDPKAILPKTTDDPVKGIWSVLPANHIGIVPGADPSAQLIISAISVTKDAQKPELLSLLGASGIVYVTQGNIYLANYVYDYNQAKPESSKANMKIYRIQIADGKIVANGTGSVPGTAINQFAMDEYNGYFRIATTDSGAFWGRSSTNSESAIYVLDNNLKTVGQVGKLGPGETIRSVRFMGDKAYIVTFQTTDPLYVLDMKTPTAPKVLGELKIPGYSSYLHPYGENLLLGFGYDAVAQGNNAIQKGLKVSLFDISDLNNPKERSTIVLGGQGSYSELLDNHKALLFSKEKNLIAFPAMLTGSNGSMKGEGGMLFQGLIVMSVENENKLVLRGGLTNSKRLTSLTGDGVSYSQITKEDQMAFSGYDSINRSVYIGDRIITLSGRMIRQYNLSNLKLLGETTLTGYDEFYQYNIDAGTAVPEIIEPVIK